MRGRFKILTVGCKANFADSVSLVREAARSGFEVVSSGERADIVVVNGCAVTHRADRDSRALVRRARRENPAATVILTGCYAEVAGRTAVLLPEADRWLRTGEARDFLRREGGGAGEDGLFLSEFGAGLLLGHRRTFLKIQDGCDFACAYCIVPRARGRGRSQPESEILEAAVRSEEAGACEIVLTGIHIGAYGTDRGEKDALARLIGRLLGGTSRVRIRLSSIEPGELGDPLLSAVAGEPRVCAHLHVPLQSGCDRTLRRMRRPYTAAEYLDAVSRAAGRIPGLNAGADVIAGFPGETRADFDETVRFLRDAPLNYLHVFPYSAREGTESARWGDDVTPAEKKERVSVLRELDTGLRAGYMRRHHGRILEVLGEKADPGRRELSGRSENYLEVAFAGHPCEVGSIHPVRITEIGEKRLFGEREARRA